MLANLYISRAIALLTMVCTLSVFLYGFFLLEAVAHTASRSSAQHSVTVLQGKLGALESQYLAQSRALTPEIASTLGFVAPVRVDSVYAPTAKPVALRDVR